MAEGKVICSKPNDLSLILRTPMVERKCNLKKPSTDTQKQTQY